ncbi:hypothetical protein Patl1_20489 [Pistacia atlantica]|uniref:Uncharacterized protein n=1 Tax=Pistacia atlantica TaxID=434234 RepID=A0ACC1BLS0_9ROSI|nr:hypothetical protein Patl1_20489 [Pistacia atlantica]
MKLPSLLLRPVSSHLISPKLSSSFSSLTLQSSIVKEVLTILDTINPIEPALDPLVPFLSSQNINSILKKTPNPQLGFRFFIWASKWKRFRNGRSQNLIIDMLLKPNGFDLYWQILEELKASDVSIVSYAFSVLISGYAEVGNCEKALEIFGKMKEFDCEPDVYTYNKILHIVSRQQVVLLTLAVYNQMLKLNCTPTKATFSILIDGLCKSGKTQDALKLFDEMMQRGISPNRITYTIVISAKRYHEAYEWYRKMLEENVEPDVVLYAVMIRGLSEAGKVKHAMKLMSEMSLRGVVPDTYCYNALIKGFCDMGLLDQARCLQLEILKRDTSPTTCTYTILICGMCRNGLVDDAQKIFNEMERAGCLPSVVTFNALIDGLCKAGELDKANLLFYKMEIGRNPSLFLRLSQGGNRVLDSASLKTMVEQYCESGLILKAYKILTKLADSGNVPDIRTYNILINGFCKANNINGAFKLFKELQLKGLSPDSVTYGTLITGLQRVGREDDALKIFDGMIKKGCTPSLAVYRSLMSWSSRRSKVSLAFSLWLKYMREISGREHEPLGEIEEHFQKGEVEKAVRGLLEMDFKLNDFSLAPYTIFLNGMCQAGQVEEALKIFVILEECKVIITPPSCVKLIHGLCKKGNLDQAIDIFLYTVTNGFILMPRICNYLLKSLLRSREKKYQAYEILSRMKSLGYDLDACLYRSTKSLLPSHWSSWEMEKSSPG